MKNWRIAYTANINGGPVHGEVMIRAHNEPSRSVRQRAARNAALAVAHANNSVLKSVQITTSPYGRAFRSHSERDGRYAYGA